MAKDLEQMTPAELKAQADAILSAADAAEAVTACLSDIMAFWSSNIVPPISPPLRYR